MTVGMIGLGLMGTAMSRNLLAAGRRVVGFDIQALACERARALGVDVVPSAREVPAHCDTILLSLMTSDDRRSLLWGEQNVASALRGGTIVLDTTTGRPTDLAEDHVRLADVGARLVDVCISGSSKVVEDRQALALIGDTADAAASYIDLLKSFTKAQYCFGAPGRGNEAKLIVNTVFGLHRLVLAEALGLATKAGFDPGEVLQVLREGETHSVAMDTKGPKMVAGVYEPAVARLEQHAKDVALILEYAKKVGAQMPVSEVHRELLSRGLDMGFGSQDNAAIFEVFRGMNETS